ncbi:MAG: hypothetical protein WBF99_23005 [Xanthobacteraceae bacterium]
MSAGADERQSVGCGEDTDLGDVERPNDGVDIDLGCQCRRAVSASDEAGAVHPRGGRGRESGCLGVSQCAERVADPTLREQIPAIEIGRLAAETKHAGRRSNPAPLDFVTDVLNDVLDNAADDFPLDIRALGRGGLQHSYGKNTCGQYAREKLK